MVATTERPKVTERPDACNCTPDAVGTLRGEYIVFKVSGHRETETVLFRTTGCGEFLEKVQLSNYQSKSLP